MNRVLDPNATVDLPTAAADPLATTDHPRGSASTDGTSPSGDSVLGKLPTVPGYRVLREIARGGMGRVLVAHDLTLDRDVALKILLPRANPDRFIRESKITARLPHPGIPPVHALGTLDDGSPFLAMKLIAGQTLAAELKTADRPRLLRVFTQVCEAVGFAHSRGVIHRDLKPANVMVGSFGEVQVMDWGLAKELANRERLEENTPVTDAPGSPEETDQTRAGTVMGTPVYMAPEVAAGNPATKAADIYGLGAILHAILTGRPPYAGGTLEEVLKNVSTAEPALFVEANSSVPAALVAICHKAMARIPEERYASTEDIATDVRHWLADEPVAVYRDPWTARAARWARRRKTTVAAGGVLLATTAIAATIAALLIWQEKSRTKFEWDRAEGEKIKATENADTAMKVVHNLSEYVHLVEFSGTQAVTDSQRKTALETALASHERLLAMNPNDAILQLNVARTQRYRANLCRVLNETREAEKSFGEANRLYGGLIAAYPENLDYRNVADVTTRDYALFLKTLGRLKEASQILDGAIRRYEEFGRAEAVEKSSLRTLALIMLDRAELDYLLGNFADAEKNSRRSAVLYERLAKLPDANLQPMDPLFRAMAEIRLAITLRELGRTDDALAVHDRVVGRFAEILKVGATRDNLNEYYRALAERAWTLAQLPTRRDSGMADLDAAIIGWEKLVKQFPLVPAYPRSQGMGTLYRGRLKFLLNQREAAAQDFNAAAKIFEVLVGKHSEIPIYRSFLGQTYMALGQLDPDLKQADEWYRKAREMFEDALKRSPENAQDRKALAGLHALAKVAKP